MKRSQVALRLTAVSLVALLLAGAFPVAAQSEDASEPAGALVQFPLARFDDTLFASVDAAYRVAFDARGHLWYSTEAGVVHVDPAAATRELFTRREGLPSSYTMGIAVGHGHVYAATDLGLGVIDTATGGVTALTPQNSPVPDQIVHEVAVDGADVWLGTRFQGVAVWNTTLDTWTYHNTSTTPAYAKPVRRIVPTAESVWIATDGDGVWRYDRATKELSVLLMADGLRSNSVLSVVERGDDVWFGTDRGLQRRSPDKDGTPDEWRLYNASDGLPDERILDLDLVLTEEDTVDVLASTRKGAWQLDPDTGRSAVRAQSFGILGAYVFDNVYSTHGWAFATSRGVSLQRGGEWSYYATGPTNGPTNGPIAFGFTSASVGDSDRFLWFGASNGVSAYRLPEGGEPGYWQNFGPWQNYPGSVVNHIDTDGNVTWIATNQGTYGLNHDTGEWIPKLAVNSRNLVYGLEADRGELWIALFGDGLIMTNLTTGVFRTWDFQSPLHPLPDQYITDVRVEGDNVWLGSSVGVIRLDRVSGAVRGTYTRADGIPGDGVIFRTLPEGPTVWVGTKSGGLAKFDVATGKVSKVWNSTETPGWPGGQTRSLYREGSRLWVGSTEGLARLDVTTGEFRTYNQSASGLVQNYVNGITSADGILYLATLSGIARLDIAKDEFLPLHDGPGVVRSDGATGPGAAAGAARVSVRIESPRDGGAVTGATEVRGTAFRLDGRVDRVEVRIGNGSWMPATGTESWSYEWDTTGLAPNQPVAIAARAFSGEAASREVEIVVTPIPPPTIPLSVQGVPMTGNASAQKALQVAARVEGDEPLSAYVYYRPTGSASYQSLPLTRQGGLFLGTIPGKDVKEGELAYYLEARSGLLTATDPADPARPHKVTVASPPRVAVSVEGPALVTATAGVPASFALNVTNVGSEPASFVVKAAGLRASWVRIAADALELEPGESRLLHATLEAPGRAFADNTTLTFEVRDARDQAEPSQASVPVRIQAAGVEAPTTNAPETGNGRVIPFPLPLLAALVAALLLGRRLR